MSGTWDATITLVHAADEEGSFAVAEVGNGAAFGVVAHVRIGKNLMQFVDRCELFVSVRNLSQSSTLLQRRQAYALAPRDAPLSQRLHLKVADGWGANEGDALEVLATFKVTAGVNHDHSIARSAPVVVTG
jgi:hypothetical protein